MNFASPDAADVSMSDHVSRCSGLCLESRTGRRQPSQHRRRHDGLRELPKRFCQYSLPEVQRRYSAAAERSLSLSHRPTAAVPWLSSPFWLNRMFPAEGQLSVATLPQQSEASPEQSSDWSRVSNCVSTAATDATMSDRVSLSSGSASELSWNISDASMHDPEKSAPMGGSSAANVLPLSESQIEAQDEWEACGPSLPNEDLAQASYRYSSR